jgi:hypothetical protein
MSEELLNLLARLREPGDNPLTDDELTTLLTGLREHADELRDADRTDEVVTALREIAESVAAVRAEQSTRSEAAAERDRQAEEALAQIAQSDADAEDGEGSEGADGAEGGSDAGQGDTGTEAAPAAGDAAGSGDTSAPVAASAARTTPARPALGQVRAPAQQRPRPTGPDPSHARTALVAAGDLPDFSAGTEIASWDRFSAAAAKKMNALKSGTAILASIVTEFPEDRRLGDSVEENEAKWQKALEPSALTAAGGICSPVAVDYNVEVLSTADRPIRDGLPRFGAERGGLTCQPEPLITDTIATAATALWTAANDASPSAPATKPVATLACGTPTTVLVDAIPTRVKLGNMAQRFSPEWVAGNMQIVLAYAARFSDLNLWSKIAAVSTEVTSAKLLGATRDLLATVDLACAAIRYRRRVPRTRMLRVILPELARDMIRADLTRELAHDRSQDNNLQVTDAQIDAYFAARGVRPIWSLDGLPAKGSAPTYPLQGFGAQTADVAINDWPTKVVFTIFVEGGFQFLDGGRLDLGIVRDSTLNNTNDAEAFVESFENVAHRAGESLHVISTVRPSGGSAGSVDTSTY